MNIARLLLVCLACVSGYNVVPRRQALSVGLGVASLAVPLAPAVAKSKASQSPNKPEGVGANAGQYMSQVYKDQKNAMVGDKGSRGVASAEFDKNDKVVKSRKEYNGLPPTKVNGKTRTAEDMGLKQWGG